jgi:predicted alpha/beta hydrolase family esterase
MSRVIFIHGNGSADGSEEWFPYCKHQLEKLGVEVLTPDFPDRPLCHMNIWLPYLEKDLQADANTVLVGHSTGTVAAMRYAETHKIGGSVLVAAYYTDLGYDDEKEAGYFDKPWQWDAIQANQPWIVQFASTDDPYIPIAEARFVRDKLAAEYHEFDGQGHFGEHGSKPEFPELLAVLKEKLHL